VGCLFLFLFGFLPIKNPPKDSSWCDYAVPVNQAVEALKETILAAKRAKKGTIVGSLAELVIAAEGVRTVDRNTREVIHNIFIKAISYAFTFGIVWLLMVISLLLAGSRRR
jgi:hypothetical protein